MIRASAEKSRTSVKILFLGQCLNYGYAGVERHDAFPALAYSALSSQFPQLKFRVDLKYFHHPKGLMAVLKHRLVVSRPDIVVISLPAMFAARHWRVSTIYQIAPEVVDTARSFLLRIEEKVRGQQSCVPETLLDKTFTRHPPIPLDEYERVVEEGLAYCLRKGNCRPILMGPGRFNDDTIEDYAIHSPELWHAVNEMVLKLAERWGVPVINAQDALSEFGGDVFIPNNHRWSLYGHQVVAREVESIVASEVRRLQTGMPLDYSRIEA